MNPPIPKRQTNMDVAIDRHITPISISDKIAFSFVKLLRFFADFFLQDVIATER